MMWYFVGEASDVDFSLFDIFIFGYRFYDVGNTWFNSNLSGSPSLVILNLIHHLQ